MQHKKNLGQHFLKDQNVIDKLVKYINPTASDVIIEIGPGDGAMTKSIANKVAKITVIEKDSDLINTLKEILVNKPDSHIINQDILKYDLNSLREPTRIIGNLPYNISTEIIFKICRCNEIIDMHFMLQKEVVDRIVSEPNSKIYGRLSVMVQAYFTIKKLFDISENVFLPKPKVKSSFIKLEPKENVFDNENHEIIFYDIVKSAFEGRRKMIRSSLGSYLKESDFTILNIHDQLRAENLTVDNFIQISKYVEKI